MFFYNQYAHKQLLTDELKRLLPVGSFAQRLWRTIGAELHYRLVDWPFDDETEFSSLFPVEALFTWATEGGGLDPEWLANEDGSYLDDDGEVIPQSVKPSYSAVEQLAAYGLWLISDLSAVGLDDDCFDEQGYDKDGQTRDFLIETHASRILFAYQSLSYCQRILSGTRPTAEDESRAKKFDFSALGKAGAQKRHAPMVELRSWALRKYSMGHWNSANQAAHELKDSVINHGRTINAHLSEENAQRTIAEWFRRSG